MDIFFVYFVKTNQRILAGQTLKMLAFLVIIIIQRNERYSYTDQGRIQTVGVMNLR